MQSYAVQIQDRHAEIRVFRSRALFASVFVIGIFSLLIGRLVYLQVLDHEHFSTLSRNNRVRLMAVPPTRGLIFDRHGRIIAENRPSRQLEIIPEEIKDLDATLADLGGIMELEETDIQRFHKIRKRRGLFESIPLKFNLSDVEVARFSVNKHRFPGVEIEAKPSRHYPYGATGVHAIGYVGRIDENDLQSLDDANYKATSHVGKVGIEEYYESRLHGTIGVRHVEVNVEGRVLQQLEKKAAVPGDNLYLSLDIEMQSMAERALGEFNGSVVTIQVDTGDIITFVSQPTYDPHPFVNGISHQAFRELSSAKTRPLYNRALKGQYPPGSTLKPFIGLAALESGLETYEHVVRCKGYYLLPNEERRYRDWGVHGRTGLKKAIERSCDVFFYDLAYRMGIDRLSRYLRLFGLGSKTEIDLLGEKAGLIPDKEWKKRAFNMPWFPGETLNSGLGQGYMLVTPLQLATATAAFARGGKLLRPRLVRAVENESGEKQEIKSIDSQLVQFKDFAHWEFIRDAMEGVVYSEGGTAKHIAVGAKYTIAGKTGTAQVISIKQDEEYDEESIAKHLRDHALFIAFAPVENPQIAIAVVVENGGGGGKTAAPIARKVMDYYFSHNVGEG